MIKPQLNYCPLVWMFCSKKSNNLANKVQERALRLTYKDNENNFQTLLNENNEASVHQRNLQFLMTEVYKTKNIYAPPIMHHLFQFRENSFSLRNFREFSTHKKKTLNYRLETVRYMAPFLWAKLPSEYKNPTSLRKFKMKIKNWKADKIYPCRLCKVYLSNWWLNYHFCFFSKFLNLDTFKIIEINHLHMPICWNYINWYYKNSWRVKHLASLPQKLFSIILILRRSRFDSEQELLNSLNYGNKTSKAKKSYAGILMWFLHFNNDSQNIWD